MSKFLTMVVTMLAFGALVAPAANANVVTQPSSFLLSPTQTASVRVVFPGNKQTYNQICFSFSFGLNSLDPGEVINLSILGGNQADVGFYNPYNTPQTSRMLCLERFYQPTLVAAFDDNHQTVRISMPVGSATVSKFIVSGS